MFIIGHFGISSSPWRSFTFPFRICDNEEEEKIHTWWRPGSNLPTRSFIPSEHDIFGVNSKILRLLRNLASLEYLERVDFVGCDRIDVKTSNPRKFEWKEVGVAIMYAFQLEVR